MGAAPHRVDSEHEGPSAGPDRDGEPRTPQPLPQADKQGSRTAVLVMLVALAIIVLVVLL